jgi:hypothetical protein
LIEFGGRIKRIGFHIPQDKLIASNLDAAFLGVPMYECYRNGLQNWEYRHKEFQQVTGSQCDIIRINGFSVFGHAMRFISPFFSMEKLETLYWVAFPTREEATSAAEQLERSRQIATELTMLIKSIKNDYRAHGQGADILAWVLSVLDAQIPNATFSQVSNDYRENKIIAAVLELSTLTRIATLHVERLRRCLDADARNWISILWFLAEAKEPHRSSFVSQLKSELDSAWLESSISRLDAATAKTVRVLLT